MKSKMQYIKLFYDSNRSYKMAIPESVASQISDIIDEYTQLLADIIAQYGANEFVTGYQETPSLKAPTLLDFDLVQQQAVEFAKEYETPFLSDLRKTDRKRVFNILTEILEKGGTVYDFQKRIDQTGLFSKVRAERIFRTELLRFNNAGALQRFKNDEVPFKELIVTEPCPICRKIREITPIVPVDHPFYGGLIAPPFHPNCRCTILPRYELPDGYVIPPYAIPVPEEWKVGKVETIYREAITEGMTKAEIRKIKQRKYTVRRVTDSEEFELTEMEARLRELYFKDPTKVTKEIAWITDNDGRLIYQVDGTYGAVSISPQLTNEFDNWLIHIHPADPNGYPELPSFADLVELPVGRKTKNFLIITPLKNFNISIRNVEEIADEYLRILKGDFEERFEKQFIEKYREVQGKHIKVLSGEVEWSKYMEKYSFFFEFDLDMSKISQELADWFENEFNDSFKTLIKSGDLKLEIFDSSQIPDSLLVKKSTGEGWRINANHIVEINKYIVDHAEELDLPQNLLEMILKYRDLKEPID
jgi:SPP1 gp7 family putative phage head morphogenesis protein